MSYLSAGEAIQSQKGLEGEETAPQAALPGATGFHPRLTQRNLMEEKRGQALSDLLSTSCGLETAKCCSDSAAPYGTVWEGITSLIPCL